MSHWHPVLLLGFVCLFLAVPMGFEFRASHLLDRHFYHLTHSASPFFFLSWVLSNYLPGEGEDFVFLSVKTVMSLPIS
jgi:hypothetical protein